MALFRSAARRAPVLDEPSKWANSTVTQRCPEPTIRLAQKFAQPTGGMPIEMSTFLLTQPD
jgi:hypothetical protein